MKTLIIKSKTDNPVAVILIEIVDKDYIIKIEPIIECIDKSYKSLIQKDNSHREFIHLNDNAIFQLKNTFEDDYQYLVDQLNIALESVPHSKWYRDIETIEDSALAENKLFELIRWKFFQIIFNLK